MIRKNVLIIQKKVNKEDVQTSHFAKPIRTLQVLIQISLHNILSNSLQVH